jgi:hypothetical protein
MDESTIVSAIAQMQELIRSTLSGVAGESRADGTSRVLFPSGVQDVYFKLTLGAPPSVEVEISAAALIHAAGATPSAGSSPPPYGAFRMAKPMKITNQSTTGPLTIVWNGNSYQIPNGASATYDVSKGDAIIEDTDPPPRMAKPMTVMNMSQPAAIPVSVIQGSNDSTLAPGQSWSGDASLGSVTLHDNETVRG